VITRHFSVAARNGSTCSPPANLGSVGTVGNSEEEFWMTARQAYIQVSGDESFAGERWREAILYYLNGVWADKPRVMYRPKLSFDTVALRLDQGTGTYYGLAKRPRPELTIEEVPQFLPHEREQIVGNSQMEVEGGLMRFVRNDQIYLLEIRLSQDSWIRLWKGRNKRGELYLDFKGLPTMLEVLQSQGVLSPSR
jgi:hypothetical protein